MAINIILNLLVALLVFAFMAQNAPIVLYSACPSAPGWGSCQW